MRMNISELKGMVNEGKNYQVELSKLQSKIQELQGSISHKSNGINQQQKKMAELKHEEVKEI